MGGNWSCHRLGLLVVLLLVMGGVRVSGRGRPGLVLRVITRYLLGVVCMSICCRSVVLLGLVLLVAMRLLVMAPRAVVAILTGSLLTVDGPTTRVEPLGHVIRLQMGRTCKCEFEGCIHAVGCSIEKRVE